MKAITFTLICSTLFACGGINPSSSGSTTATFVKNTTLSINLAATCYQLLLGKFTTDSYNDMIVLTNGGPRFYQNQSGTSWASAANISNTSGLDYTVGVAADLNNDSNHLLDLILFGTSVNLVTVLNGGSSGGTFASSTATTTTATSPQSMTYVAHSTSATQGFAVIGAGGSGHTFVSQTSGSWGSSNAASGSAVTPETGVIVLAADINGDGKQDFAIVPRTGSNPIEMWINSGNSTFVLDSVTISPASTHTIRDAALIDMNNDSKPDFVLATSSGLVLQLNARTSTTSLAFTESSALSGFTGNFVSMAVADFTGDSRPDLFLGRSGTTGALISQTGTLVFTEITSTAFSGDLATAPNRAYGVDLNNDGRLDIVELNSGGTVTVHINSGS